MKDDLINSMILWEDGQLGEKEEVQFFSELIKSGMAWSLQGMYGRHAQGLIKNGYLDKEGNILIKEYNGN